MGLKGSFSMPAIGALAFLTSLLLLIAPVSEVRGATPGIAWLDRYDGPPNGSDHASAVAMDDEGNVYVTGSSTGAGAGSDITTIKYDAEGNELWVARYDWDVFDGARYLDVDGAGNVYVSGSSGVYYRDQWIYYLYDYVTIKYDPDGNQLWVARYDGPGHGDDRVAGLAVDGAGNVYVAGTSRDMDYSDDYATVKYDSDGNQVWVARHEDPESGSARVRAMALDGAENVYVTGSAGTVKYGAAGNQLWLVPIDGYTPAHLAVDDTGNAVVTGGGSGVLPDDRKDILTTRYDPDGNELWAARYSGPAQGYDSPDCVAVDGLGNTYVTGRSAGVDTESDFATIKYDPDGNELWVARHDGPDHWEDAPQSLMLDGAGNLLVTGYATVSGGADFTTVKYDSAGNQLWVTTYNGPRQGEDWAHAVAVNALGRVAVTGASQAHFGYDGYSVDSPGARESDYATVVYDSGGVQVWEASYAGEGPGYDRVEEMFLDEAGGLYVTGSSGTIKYSRTGGRLWTAPEGGGSMALDPDGNLLLAGTSKGTAKLDGDGGLLWSVQDGCSSIVVDGAGSVYAAGSGYRTGSGTDFHTIKYDSAGNPLWEAWYDGPLGGLDVAGYMALDSAGNVIVAGHSSRGYEYSDLATIKYDPQGNELWVARYEGCYEVADLVVDGGDNVIVTCTNGNYLTVKYDPNGSELWVAEYIGPGDGSGYSFDQPAALAVDSAGNVYVTGESRSYSTPGFAPETQCEMMVGEPAPRRASQAACSPEFHASGATYTHDYATVKYDPNGNQLWAARYSGLLDLYFWDERATDVAVDHAGNVYVTGNRSAYYMLMHDVVTIKYSPFGTELWKVAYDGPAHCTEQATSIALDEAGDVYVAGGSIGVGTRKDYLTIKYSESALSVWNAPASAEAAGPVNQTSAASGRFGVIFAFFTPLLVLALLRRRFSKSR